MVGENLLYTVENVEKSVSDVLVGITDGLNSMNAGGVGASFEGGIVMLLSVPSEWAEIVEAAATRCGIELARFDPDET